MQCLEQNQTHITTYNDSIASFNPKHQKLHPFSLAFHCSVAGLNAKAPKCTPLPYPFTVPMWVVMPLLRPAIFRLQNAPLQPLNRAFVADRNDPIATHNFFHALRLKRFSPLQDSRPYIYQQGHVAREQQPPLIDLVVSKLSSEQSLKLWRV